jgi:hypothetical protein
MCTVADLVNHGEPDSMVVTGWGCGVRQTRAQIPPLLHASCVTLLSDLTSPGLCLIRGPANAFRWLR